MKHILSALVVISVFTAHGAINSGETMKKNLHHAYAGGSFTAGGLAFGGDYEYTYRRTYGIGAYGRIYSKDEKKNAHGLVAVGAFVRPHFHRANWDLHFTGGFSMQSVSGVGTNSSETAFGPAFGIGILYQWTETIAFGLDQLDHYGWFSDDYKGVIMSDLAIRGRMSF